MRVRVCVTNGQQLLAAVMVPMTVTALLCSISLADSPHTQSLGFTPPPSSL